MKKILILISFCAVGLALSAQNLYVQPINGEQVAFSFTDKPAVTFGEGTMRVQTASQAQSWNIEDVQNLSFTENTSDLAMNLTENSEIRLFPNPVENELELSLSNFSQGFYYQIFDLAGQPVASDKIHAANIKIQMGTFRSGVYVLQVHQDGKPVQSFKIVKN